MSNVYYITVDQKTKEVVTYTKKNKGGIVYTPGITGSLKGWKKLKKQKQG